jgi:hypothetical protein
MEGALKEEVHSILVQLSKDYSDHLMLTGIIDEKARSIDYQRGLTELLRLPSRGNRDIDIRVSLVFALAKQLGDYTGPLAHAVLTYDDCEVIIMDVAPGLILYAICTPGLSSDIVDSLTVLAGEITTGETDKKWMTAAGRDREPIAADWSGR